MKDSDLDAGKKLLESARIAAKEVKVPLFWRIWNDYWERRERRFAEKKCQSGTHMVMNWELQSANHVVYPKGAHPDKGDLPTSIHDVYVGTCKYCNMPFSKKISLT